jgi:hypothetical protein
MQIDCGANTWNSSLKGKLEVFHVDAVVAYGRVGIAPPDEGEWIEDHGTHWLGTV